MTTKSRKFSQKYPEIKINKSPEFKRNELLTPRVEQRLSPFSCNSTRYNENLNKINNFKLDEIIKENKRIQENLSSTQSVIKKYFNKKQPDKKHKLWSNKKESLLAPTRLI